MNLTHLRKLIPGAGTLIKKRTNYWTVRWLHSKARLTFSTAAIYGCRARLKRRECPDTIGQHRAAQPELIKNAAVLAAISFRDPLNQQITTQKSPAAHHRTLTRPTGKESTITRDHRAVANWRTKPPPSAAGQEHAQAPNEHQARARPDADQAVVGQNGKSHYSRQTSANEKQEPQPNGLAERNNLKSKWLAPDKSGMRDKRAKRNDKSLAATGNREFGTDQLCRRRRKVLWPA